VTPKSREQTGIEAEVLSLALAQAYTDSGLNLGLEIQRSVGPNYETR